MGENEGLGIPELFSALMHTRNDYYAFPFQTFELLSDLLYRLFVCFDVRDKPTETFYFIVKGNYVLVHQRVFIN